jgi:hypothetical protein
VEGKSGVKKWLLDNTFKVHLAAFLLMTIAGALLYWAAISQSVEWIWILLGLVVTGNVLVLLVR